MWTAGSWNRRRHDTQRTLIPSGFLLAPGAKDFNRGMARSCCSKSHPKEAQAASAGRAGIERMWVIGRRRLDGFYVGVLDSTPLDADSRSLRRGSTIVFAPEHIADISRPDREYVVARYGETFFDTST